MNKKIVALAAMLVSGIASAQTSVTLFGSLDTNVQHGTGSVGNLTRVSSGGLASPKLGFRGTEDLGGGLMAGFWIETGFNPDTGAGAATNTNNQASGAAPAGTAGGQGMTFNRRSTVSLGSSWGEVRLGRDYTAHYWVQDVFDPFSNLSIGASQVDVSAITGVTTVRASNAISYLYGHGFNAGSVGYGPDGFEGSGFQAQVSYYLGENLSNAANPDDGKGYGIRGTYSTGPFVISAAAGTTRYAAGNVHQNGIGASYNFGFVNLMAQYEADKNGAIDARGFIVGAVVPVGSGRIRVAYSRYRSDAASNPTAGKWAVGYVHNLSKRTALYTTFAHVTNKGTSAQALAGSVTAAGTSSNGYEFGVRHNF